MASRRRLRIVVTPGDPDGIGPEVTVKALRKGGIPAGTDVVCIGSRAGLESVGFKPAAKRSGFTFVPAPETAPSGRLLAGYQCGWSIEEAVAWLKDGRADALVTGPISKERLQAGGYRFNGHTDFLAHLADSSSVTMMLANPKLRISLVTTHLPLARVADKLSAAEFRRAVLHTLDHLTRDLGIRKPRIGVAALNPHAGENGILGREEIEILNPEIERLRAELGSRCVLTEPLASDTLFVNHLTRGPKERFDAVICMYHDQGLIPVKLLDFPHTVNVSLGLPFIRTSVDHGTGFDIAGRNKADPSSMRAAVHLAVQLARIKNRRTKARA